MKYFGPYTSMSGQQTSEYMISNTYVLLLAPFLDLLIWFSLMQSTQVWKLVKSKVLSTSSFTNLLILYMEICPNLLCHNIEEFSFITHHFVPVWTCIVLLGVSFFKLIEKRPLDNVLFPTRLDLYINKKNWKMSHKN